MPSRSKEQEGITVIVTPGPLLLVVYRGARDLFTAAVGYGRGHSAALAVSRHDNPATGGDLTAFLDVEAVRMVVDLRDRPHLLIRIAGDGIVFAVELASPLIMRRLAVLVGAIDRDLHLVTRSLVH